MSQIHKIASGRLKNLYGSMTTSMYEAMAQIAQRIVIPNQTALPQAEIYI